MAQVSLSGEKVAFQFGMTQLERGPWEAIPAPSLH